MMSPEQHGLNCLRASAILLVLGWQLKIAQGASITVEPPDLAKARTEPIRTATETARRRGHCRSFSFKLPCPDQTEEPSAELTMFMFKAGMRVREGHLQEGHSYWRFSINDSCSSESGTVMRSFWLSIERTKAELLTVTLPATPRAAPATGSNGFRTLSVNCENCSHQEVSNATLFLRNCQLSNASFSSSSESCKLPPVAKRRQVVLNREQPAEGETQTATPQQDFMLTCAQHKSLRPKPVCQLRCSSITPPRPSTAPAETAVAPMTTLPTLNQAPASSQQLTSILPTSTAPAGTAVVPMATLTALNQAPTSSQQLAAIPSLSTTSPEPVCECKLAQRQLPINPYNTGQLYYPPDFGPLTSTYTAKWCVKATAETGAGTCVLRECEKFEFLSTDDGEVVVLYVAKRCHCTSEPTTSAGGHAVQPTCIELP